MVILERLVRAIDNMNRHVGRAVAWLALVMALIQFAVVILRYVFSIGFIPLQESIWYLHGILFMVGAGYTLMHDGHVRVDVFYSSTTDKRRAQIDLAGAVLFLVPLCVLTLWLSSSYVVNSWRILERSTEVSGLPFIYVLKTMIWIFAVLVGLQGVALAARALLYLAGATNSYSADAGQGPGQSAPEHSA